MAASEEEVIRSVYRLLDPFLANFTAQAADLETPVTPELLAAQLVRTLQRPEMQPQLVALLTPLVKAWLAHN